MIEGAKEKKNIRAVSHCMHTQKTITRWT